MRPMKKLKDWDMIRRKKSVYQLKKYNLFYQKLLYQLQSMINI